MNNIFAETVSRTHPLLWVTNEPLKRYKHGRPRLVPSFHLYWERCLSNKAFFMGEGCFYLCLKMETEVEHVWLVWNYSAGVPVDPVVKSWVVEEEVDGESLRPNALSNTKKSFLPTPLLSLLFHPLNWLSPPRHKSARALGVGQEAKLLRREFAARSQD